MAEDITDYGASANPNDPGITEAKTNQQAITDAADAAGAGGTVHVPEGEFYFGSNDVANQTAFGNREPAGISFTGVGPQKSKLAITEHLGDQNHWMFRYNDGYDHGTVTWDDIWIDGNYENLNLIDLNRSGRGVVADGSGEWHFTNVLFRGLYSTGFFNSAQARFVIDRCSFREISVGSHNDSGGNTGSHAIASSGAPSGQTSRVTNSEFYRCARCVMDANDGSGTGTTRFENCWGKSIALSWVKWSADQDLEFKNVYAEIRTDWTRNTLDDTNKQIYGRQFLGRISADSSNDVPVADLQDCEIRSTDRHAVEIYGGNESFVVSASITGDNIAWHDHSLSPNRDSCWRDDRDGNLDNVDVGTMSVHGTDGSVFNTPNADGTIAELRRNNNSGGLGDTGSLTISTDDTGASALSPVVPSQDDVGINTAQKQFFTDFGDITLSDEWTPHWEAALSDYAIVTSADSIHGGQYLELDPADVGRRALSWDSVGSPADTEVLGLVRVPSFNPDRDDYARLYARVGGGVGSESAYFFQIHNDSQFEVSKYSGGSLTNALVSYGDPVADTWYWMRFRITNTDTTDEYRLRVKKWPQGTSEPSGWDADFFDTDATIPDQGPVAFGGFTAQPQQCDWFAVGTGGESAPLPSGVNVSAAPSGPVEVGAETTDISASTTSPFVSADGPVEVGTDVPDAGASVANVSAAPSGPVEVGTDVPDIGLFLETDSEAAFGEFVWGDFVLGSRSDNVSAAPSGPVEVGTDVPDAGGHVYIEFTTALPDVSELSVDDTVEGQLTPNWTDTINNGSYRIQYKISTTVAWLDSGTVGHETTSKTIGSLVDGEEYDIRVRTETEHVTGAWVTATATTPLPAPTNLDTVSESATEWRLVWNDNSDNEDTYRVERRREYDDGFGPWMTLAEEPENTTSYTDDGVVPETTYEYRVTAVTDDAEASATAQFTTPSLGYGTERITPSGWTVEIDRSDTGATRRPAIVGEPRYDPSLNSLPEVRLPVAQDDAWSQSHWEDAPIRVWRDGVRLPIEQVNAVEQQPGQTVITALGGTELLEPQTHEFDDSDAHAAANAVIDNTSYAKVVDDPSADQSQLADPDTDAELREYFEDPADASDPVIVDNGQRMAQTTFWVEGEDEVASGSVIDNVDHPNGDPVWSGAEAADVDNAGGVALTITTEHVIPAADFGIAVRYNNDNLDADWAVYVDGTEISRLSWGGSTTSDTAALFDLSSGTATWLQSDLQPGDHTIEFRIENRVSGTTYLDAMAIYDGGEHDPNNWSFTSWDTDVYFNDPPLYPTGGTDAVLLHEGFQSATGATFDGTFDDLSGAQGIALSNDGGSNYTTAANTDTLDVDFSSPGPDIQLRVTYDAYGSRAIGTPLQNFKTQTLTDYTIDIDTRNSPPLQDDVFRSEGRQILTRLAERGIGLWAVTWDDTNGLTVEFTNAGQRTSTETLDLVDYAWSKETLGRQIEWAVVRGAAQPVQGEEFTADAGGDALDQNNLVPGRERVYDTSKVYTRGTDYTINYEVGEISRETGGDLTSGDTYQVDYEWKPEGEYARGATDPKKKLEETFVGATTDTLCRSIAYYLTDPEQLGAPVRSGEAVISDLPPGVSVLDALALDPVPETDTYHVEGIERRPGEVRLQLASRESISDVVGDVRSRLEDASERV